MLRLLDLTWSILKWSLWLTLVRLAGTAFGCEFGVSRQYLRLLEWLFQRGQERIARVDSEHRMHLDQLDEQLNGRNTLEANSSEFELTRKRPKTLELNGGETCEVQEKENHHQDQLASNGNGLSPAVSPLVSHPKRKVSILRGHFECRLRECENGLETSCEDGKSAANLNRRFHVEERERRRRVSTPDGPPVFLLDDDDEDEEADEDEADQGDELANSAKVCKTIDCNIQLANAMPPTAGRSHSRHEFHLEDAARFVSKGVSAICDDEVTKRFTPEELKSWNLLTRTNAKNYQFMSRSLGLYWLCGLLIRYVLLMPLRILFTIVGTLWLISTMSLLGILVPRCLRDKPFRLMSLMSFRMLACGITSRLDFHDQHHRAQGGDICVANHTSPIDVLLLACDNCYALVGQRHAGLLGILEMALSRATNHVWFDRGEMRDRQLVTQRLKEHVSLKSNLPVLIFPEGTCINNSAVMMFRKGSFETNARICPVAIKYDSRFGDPFWNSAKQSYLEYLLMMMSSWAIKCDVWYLPPMERLAHESSAEFANRVKAAIAKRAGLRDLAWDGQLKRSSVKPTWLYQQQEDYVKRLKLE